MEPINVRPVIARVAKRPGHPSAFWAIAYFALGALFVFVVGILIDLRRFSMIARVADSFTPGVPFVGQIAPSILNTAIPGDHQSSDAVFAWTVIQVSLAFHENLNRDVALAASNLNRDMMSSDAIRSFDDSLDSAGELKQFESDLFSLCKLIQKHHPDIAEECRRNTLAARFFQ